MALKWNANYNPTNRNVVLAAVKNHSLGKKKTFLFWTDYSYIQGITINNRPLIDTPWTYKKFKIHKKIFELKKIKLSRDRCNILQL